MRRPENQHSPRNETFRRFSTQRVGSNNDYVPVTLTGLKLGADIQDRTGDPWVEARYVTSTPCPRYIIYGGCGWIRTNSLSRDQIYSLGHLSYCTAHPLFYTPYRLTPLIFAVRNPIFASVPRLLIWPRSLQLGLECWIIWCG